MHQKTGRTNKPMFNIADTKSTYKKSFVFLYTNNKLLGRKIKKIISFTVASKTLNA